MSDSQPRRPRYPAAASIRTRASASEATPDDFAPTALDRPHLPDALMASAGRVPAAPPERLQPAAPSSRSSRLLVLLGVAFIGLCVIGGALTGAWLALR